MRSALILAATTLLAAFARAQDADNSTSTSIPADNSTATTVIANAQADNIDLSVLPNLDAVLAEIAAVAADASTDAARRRSVQRRAGVSKGLIDVHTHIVPDWYRALNPTTGGNPTPSWNVSMYEAFMKTSGIQRSIFAISAPGANVYRGEEGLTTALARLINEQSAAYAKAYPTEFSFYAVMPLPYTTAAIAEATYALDTLGAAGIVLYSNHEGMYLGHPQFKPFFTAINKRKTKTVVYVHPATPYMKVGDQWIEANPTTYPTGNIEFYFETARTLEDLAASQTILNFTSINYIIPHAGGAWPAVTDRLLKSYPAIYDRTLDALRTRFWYDSAGPTFYHQVAGLLAYGVPASQLLFGTDFPYAPAFTQAGSLAALQASTFVTDAEKTALFTTNPKSLFSGKIKF